MGVDAHQPQRFGEPLMGGFPDGAIRYLCESEMEVHQKVSIAMSPTYSNTPSMVICGDNIKWKFREKII